MALTYGFYSSLKKDRKYNAEQFGSIFDGVIHDGVYINIGGQMIVKASTGMQVNIQTGRAWFNHTWTLNDAIYPITLPESELLLPKYVAVVLEIDKTLPVRANSFKVVSGTPATQPVYPELEKNASIKQYPLAYILIKEGATEITQSDITNMVGTSECPFVTSVAASMDIDDLIAKWEDQWNRWLRNSETEYSGLTSSFRTFMESSEAQFITFVQNNQEIFNRFLGEKGDIFNASLSSMEDNFGSFWDDFRKGMEEYLEAQETIWENWFEHIKGQLSEDAATHLQDQIDQINYIYVIGRRAVFGSWAVITDNKLVVSKPAV